MTSQSTRRRISRRMCNELATALIVRAVPLPSTKVDQVRRYLWNAFGDAVYKQEWEATNRSTEALKNDALKEVLKVITDENITEPGPASLELMVRAAYPLVVTGSITDDRGSKNNDQPDRRILWEVLDRMRFSKQGIHQLARRHGLRRWRADSRRRRERSREAATHRARRPDRKRRLSARAVPR